LRNVFVCGETIENESEYGVVIELIELTNAEQRGAAKIYKRPKAGSLSGMFDRTAKTPQAAPVTCGRA